MITDATRSSRPWDAIKILALLSAFLMPTGTLASAAAPGLAVPAPPGSTPFAPSAERPIG